MGLHPLSSPSNPTDRSSVRGIADPIWMKNIFNCFRSLYTIGVNDQLHRTRDISDVDSRKSLEKTTTYKAQFSFSRKGLPCFYRKRIELIQTVKGRGCRPQHLSFKGTKSLGTPSLQASLTAEKESNKLKEILLSAFLYFP